MASFSKLSRSMTWHQWQAEYPDRQKHRLMLSAFAFSHASGPHGNHWTGLCACCKRYGDFSPANRLVWVGLVCIVDMVLRLEALPCSPNPFPSLMRMREGSLIAMPPFLIKPVNQTGAIRETRFVI